MGSRNVRDPQWRLIYDHGVLVLSAGADRLFAMEDVPEGAAAELIDRWERDELDAPGLSPAALGLVRRLAEVGLVNHCSTATSKQRVALRWAGERHVPLERNLISLFEGSDSLRLSAGEADLLLVVRTTARLVDLYPSLELDPMPHLLVDVAYHHTISVGPLVFAGETACLACLAGRINYLWGDPEPPARPSALRAASLAAALATHELERVADEDYGLVNATVAYDLQSRRMTAGSVYRLPWCPLCGDGGESAGMIDLPWTNAA